MYAKQSGAILHPLHQMLKAKPLPETTTNITIGFRNQNPKRPLTAPPHHVHRRPQAEIGRFIDVCEAAELRFSTRFTKHLKRSLLQHTSAGQTGS